MRYKIRQIGPYGGLFITGPFLFKDRTVYCYLLVRDGDGCKPFFQTFKPAGCNVLKLEAHIFKLYAVYVDVL